MSSDRADRGRDTIGTPRRGRPTAGARRCREKFLRFFPAGFRDPTYVAWERGYKWEAHERWEEALGRAEFRRLLRAG